MTDLSKSVHLRHNKPFSSSPRWTKTEFRWNKEGTMYWMQLDATSTKESLDSLGSGCARGLWDCRYPNDAVRAHHPRNISNWPLVHPLTLQPYITGKMSHVRATLVPNSVPVPRTRARGGCTHTCHPLLYWIQGLTVSPRPSYLPRMENSPVFVLTFSSPRLRVLRGMRAFHKSCDAIRERRKTRWKK